ncbi:hypothetical protein [uncultured Pseudokineococcus sp.]|uniref:hypothetical protein n=1 Tax=uncultured Pseudokineococcus sp. TaxID=1642928 RepID=UPI002609807C|nr:hypothetical protein [uncultured Pseudokineococcus sp.]
MSEQQPDRSGDRDERPAPTAEELAGAQRVRYRRAPRYRLLIGLGVVVGALAALVLTFVATPTETYGRAAIFGYLLAGLGIVGGLLGGLVGVGLERAVRRRD